MDDMHSPLHRAEEDLAPVSGTSFRRCLVHVSHTVVNCRFVYGSTREGDNIAISWRVLRNGLTC